MLNLYSYVFLKQIPIKIQDMHVQINSNFVKTGKRKEVKGSSFIMTFLI